MTSTMRVSRIMAIRHVNSADIHYETDFRAVYAQAIDSWLGANSVSILGGDFRKASLTYVWQPVLAEQ